MAPVQRGWVSFLIDRIFGWWCGMPGEVCGYTVESLRIPVPAEDGRMQVGEQGQPVIHLAANLYRPTIPDPRGTILIRTSYGIGPLMALANARLFASRGYNVLLAACRGTDPSDGCELIPAVHEAADGLATVSWMREQPWYTGSFGTCGGSYLGYTQWALLSDPPADIKAAVISTGPNDFGGFIWGSGAMESHAIAWADLMTAPKRGTTPGPAYIKQQPELLRPVYDGVPLLQAIDNHFQNDAPDWIRHVATHPDTSDPFYHRMNQSAALEHANVPILQITGWNDPLLPTVTHQHSVLSSRHRPASLLIGPWSHLGSQRGTRIAQVFQFLDKHLGPGEDRQKTDEAHETPPVRVFVTGAREWRAYECWPPPPVSTRELFFGANKTLSGHQPPANGPDSTTFKFDPGEPTPAIGLPRPFDDVIPASYQDKALAERSDVATFTSEPLEQDLEVCGPPVVELHRSSNQPNVDVLVRVSEVDGKGRSSRVADCYKRLVPNCGPSLEKLALADCAHRFKRGMRIRVIVAGGAHPGYIRNLGTDGNQATEATMRPAWHTIHHSGDTMSRLLLPVVT